jgi:hypothetical protein
MTPDTEFRINALPFAHQTIDGEVVIVNVDNGTYYSLRDTGAEVWALLERGADAREVVRELAGRYSGAVAEITAGVERLLDDLLREGIVSPQPRDGAADRAPVAAAAATARPEFVAPILERFTDMKDLLLLDPIHEGGDSGWPIVKYPEP